MKNLVANFGLLLLSLLLCSVSLLTSADSNTSATCPMDLSYVLRIAWDQSLCQNVSTRVSCCYILSTLLGIGLAQHLKETSLFKLPDLPTSTSCLNDFQSKITALSLPTTLVSSCFHPLRFVISPNTCAHIETTKDWVKELGPTTALDSGCKSDLTDLTSCRACVSAGYQVQKELLAIDGNTSQAKADDCFYFAVLYAAGIVNAYGPESDSVMKCVVGLQFNLEEGSGDKGHSELVFGLKGAGGCCCGYVLFVGDVFVV